MADLLNSIKGCIYGGAIGDALGYPVEFLFEESIFEIYGSEGITGLDTYVVSDDTQMTLFTVNGMLTAITKAKLEGVDVPLRDGVYLSYRDWYMTQKLPDIDKFRIAENAYKRHSWICDIEELFARRAPGNTCLSSLGSGEKASISNPINRSKGCGGVMRVAPVGLINSFESIEDCDIEAAEIAAITHGHPLGYIPAAFLAHVINRIVFARNMYKKLEDIYIEANKTMGKLFGQNEDMEYFSSLIDMAIRSSKNELDDLKNIHNLGEGWVAEEAIAIAVYCSLKYQNDFSSGIIAAANHRGDSDSTAAITGNILGALLGFEAIKSTWYQHLELTDVMDELSADLCEISETDGFIDDEWTNKYVNMTRIV